MIRRAARAVADVVVGLPSATREVRATGGGPVRVLRLCRGWS